MYACKTSSKGKPTFAFIDVCASHADVTQIGTKILNIWKSNFVPLFLV